MQKNIIITGEPKSGKSTILWSVISDISHKIGIVTKELRSGDARVGFESETHNSKTALLAHIEHETQHKVSKYFVDTQSLESVLPEVSTFSEGDLLYIDEIGEMQLLSEQFNTVAQKYLDSTNTCLATLTSVYDNDFTQAIKNRNDVIFVMLTPENRVEQKEFIQMLIKKIEKAKKYSLHAGLFEIKSDESILLTSEHGIRKLVRLNKEWSCDCGFYGKYKVCSHSIATEEFSKPKI